MTGKARMTAIVSTDCKSDLETLQNELGIPQGEVLETLIEAYKELQDMKLDFSPSEQAEIDNAVINSGMDFKQLAKRGLLKEARTANSLSKHQQNLTDTDPDKLRKMTFKGVASARIDQVVHKIMDYNDSCSEQKDRQFISETLISKITGSNRQAVREYFESHKLMIEDHNNKYSLTVANNRKGKGFDIKKVLNLL